MNVWLVGQLTSTSLFSLRLPVSTTTAAKTSLVPTPYSIKIGLVDACIRMMGLEDGERLFTSLRGITLRVRPPVRLVVSNTLVKVATPFEFKGKAIERALAEEVAAEQDLLPFRSTVGFREHVNLVGPLDVAFSATEIEPVAQGLLARAWLGLRYLGKRGGTFSTAPIEEHHGDLAAGYCFPIDSPPDPCPVPVVAQPMDDVGPHAEWDRISTFSAKPIRIGQERVRTTMAIPVRVASRGRAFTAYERVNP